jgi:hypothetical protein
MALTRVRLGATAALATVGVFLVVRALVGIEFPALPRLPFMPHADGSGSTIAAERPQEVTPRPRPNPVRVAASDRIQRRERPSVRRLPAVPLPIVVPPTPIPVEPRKSEPPTPIPVEPPKIEPPPLPEPTKVEPPAPPKVEVPQPPPLPEPKPLPKVEPPKVELPTPEPPALPTLPELPPLPSLPGGPDVVTPGARG